MTTCNVDPSAWLPLVAALTTLAGAVSAAAVGVIMALRGNTRATDASTEAHLASLPNNGA